MSDREYPLQPMYGKYFKADLKKGGLASAFKATSPTKDVDQELRFGDLDRDVQPPGIRVERDVRVSRSAQDSPPSKI